MAGHREECKKCGKTSRDPVGWLECDACKLWFHASCANISKELHQALMKFEGQTSWYCEPCKGEVRRAIEGNKTLTQEVNDMKKQLNDLREQMTSGTDHQHQGNSDDLKEALREIWKDIKEIKSEMQTRVKLDPDRETVKEYVEEYMREQEDIHKIRNNLVIYNVPEPTENSNKEKLDEDTQVCTDLFESSLNFERDDVVIKKVLRLGKNSQEGRNRPVLLILRSVEEKREVLKRAKHLKN